MKLTVYLVFIISFLTISCQKDDEGIGSNCEEYKTIYSSSIIDYYQDSSIIDDDKYDGECLNIKGRIEGMAFIENAIYIGIQDFQGYGLLDSRLITCRLSGDYYTEEIREIVKQYKIRDFISIKGRYYSNPETATVGYYREINLVAQEVSTELISNENDCGVAGNRWSCKIDSDDCFRPYYWFIPSETENLLYVSFDPFNKEDGLEYETKIYRYEIDDNCDSISITEIDLSNTYEYSMEVTQNSLTLTNQEGEVTKLEK
jgi:hypothetical protein